MRNVFLVALLATSINAFAAEAGEALPAAAVQPAAQLDPVVVSKIKGTIAVDGDKARKVYAEFLASPSLTAALRSALSAQGYELVDVRDHADIAYIFDGAFQALRPATKRTAEIRVGDYAEKPDSLTTHSGRGFIVALSLNPLAVIAGTVMNTIGNASGAQDAVNGAVGDPDGKCVAKCDQWAYKQRNVVNLTRFADGRQVSTLACLTETTADTLLPSLLMAESMAGISKQAGFTLPADFPLKTKQ